MAPPEASTLVTVPMGGTGTGTIRLVDDVICALVLDGVHFDFDYTFVRPEAKTIIRELVDEINRDTARSVLVVGHTDRVGSSAYNEGLSRRRARSVFGYVTGQVDIWMDLLRTMLTTSGGEAPRSGSGQSFDRWQTRELQYMLGYLRSQTGQHFYEGPINNVFSPDTQTALDAFRAEHGLPAGGGPGPRQAGVDEDTWRALFESYIQVDAVNVDLERFLDPSTLGCGENFPRLETRPPGTESQDRADADARLETNRRVEFLLIPPALLPDPAQAPTCEVIYQDPDSPIVVCPNDPQPISVTLHFTDGDSTNPKAGLVVQVTSQGGVTAEHTTDAQGKIVLPDGETVQGDYRVSAVGNFGLVLRDTSLGQVRGAEVLLHLTQSVVVEIMVTPVPARLNFVENVDPFDQLLDALADPLTAGPVEFRLAADVDNVAGDTVTVLVSSFLIRGPASPVPGRPAPPGGVVAPPTPLEFVDLDDVPVAQVELNRRFKLRLDSAEVLGDTVEVQLSSHWFREGQPGA